MRVTVRLFARLRDLAGSGTLEAEVPDTATIATVWDEIVRRYPALAGHARVIACARNAEHARMHTHVAEGDEIAFLPPVSGG
jgi:molybdopterin converting factor subunit 1